MPVLDVFKEDVFNTVSLTTAINKLPYLPNRLGQMGLFKKNGIVTTSVMVEEKHGRLFLVPNVGRGAEPGVIGEDTRQARSFLCTHLPLNSKVYADDVQNLRAFGSETQTAMVSGVVNDKLASLRQNIEATHEWHRIGALKGILLDADGSTVIYNWYTEFGITPNTATIDWDSDTGVKTAAAGIRRTIEDALGSTPYRDIHAFVGDTIFDALTIAPETRVAYERFQNGQFLRDGQTRAMFPYAGVTWENYRGSIGSTVGKFIADAEFVAFPIGAPDIFSEHYAPANYTETVNTKGKAVYAKQERMKFDKGVDIEVQSNPLIICNRPAVLIAGDAIGTAPT